MKEILISLFKIIFIFSTMPNNESKYKEFHFTDFTKIKVKQRSDMLNLNCIIISNPKWIIYPPNNEMPNDAIYYSLPIFIKNFKSLRTLFVQGVFIDNLPIELKILPELEHIGICLSPRSDISNICNILKQIKKLKTLSLTGSIISDEVYSSIKHELPKIQVSDIVRRMQN